jgi:beta-1,4-mannosyl-glycoprotein beta-1,4-N-acetylglucosaminyltransferase
MIYDCFMFNDELETLDIRFNILKDAVDFFVIAEGNLTHSGKKKPMCFLENKQRWPELENRIIHVPVTFEPIGNKIPCIYHEFEAWPRENQQRNELINGLVGASDEDIVILSDLDEIPDPALISLDFTEDLVIFNQKWFNYYLNLKVNRTWKGSRVFKKSFLATNTLQKIRLTNKGKMVDGGWHFSYQGGEGAVHSKLASFAYVTLDQPHHHDKVKSNMANFKSFVDPNLTYSIADKDLDLPQYVKDNWESYVSKGFIINP